jgi:hypothetical protein
MRIGNGHKHGYGQDMDTWTRSPPRAWTRLRAWAWTGTRWGGGHIYVQVNVQ